MGLLVPVLPQYVAGQLHRGYGLAGLAVAMPSALGLGAASQLLGLRSGFTIAAAIPATALLLFVPWRRAVPLPTVQSDRT
jgi:hypothetical protein